MHADARERAKQRWQAASAALLEAAQYETTCLYACLEPRASNAVAQYALVHLRASRVLKKMQAAEARARADWLDTFP